MSAEFIPSGAPANALSVWADSKYIYAELATPIDQPPCILSFRRDNSGLSKMLSLIFHYADTSGDPQINPVVTRKLVGTAMQHDMAQALLRKRGLLK